MGLLFSLLIYCSSHPFSSEIECCGFAKTHFVRWTSLTGTPLPGTGLLLVSSQSSPFPATIIMCTGEVHKPPKGSSCAEARSSIRCCLSKPLLFSTSIFIFLNRWGDSNKMQNPHKWFSKINELSSLLLTSGLTISGTGWAFALLLDCFWNPWAASQRAWLW